MIKRAGRKAERPEELGKKKNTFSRVQCKSFVLKMPRFISILRRLRLALPVSAHRRTELRRARRNETTCIMRTERARCAKTTRGDPEHCAWSNEEGKKKKKNRLRLMAQRKAETIIIIIIPIERITRRHYCARVHVYAKPVRVFSLNTVSLIAVSPDRPV
jgi:hypothetical protein